MSKPYPLVERAQEFLSKRSGRPVRPEEAREAAEGLLGLFQLLREWDEKAREGIPEFESGEVRGVAPVSLPAYPSAATGPRRAAR